LLSEVSREDIINKKELFAPNRLIENSPSKKLWVTPDKKSAGAGKSPAGKGLQTTKKNQSSVNPRESILI
jgi:hypothetical protein